MSIAFATLFAVIGAIGLIALCTLAFLLHRPRSPMLESLGRRQVDGFNAPAVIAIAGLLAFLVCLYAGAEMLLWWIPNWRVDDDGVPLRFLLAGTFALVVGFALYAPLAQYAWNTRLLAITERHLNLTRHLLGAPRHVVEDIRRTVEAQLATARERAHPDNERRTGPHGIDELEVYMCRELLADVATVLGSAAPLAAPPASSRAAP